MVLLVIPVVIHLKTFDDIGILIVELFYVFMGHIHTQIWKLPQISKKCIRNTFKKNRYIKMSRSISRKPVEWMNKRS